MLRKPSPESQEYFRVKVVPGFLLKGHRNMGMSWHFIDQSVTSCSLRSPTLSKIQLPALQLDTAASEEVYIYISNQISDKNEVTAS